MSSVAFRAYTCLLAMSIRSDSISSIVLVLESVSAATFSNPFICWISVVNCPFRWRCLICLGVAFSSFCLNANVKGLWSGKFTSFYEMWEMFYSCICRLKLRDHMHYNVVVCLLASLKKILEVANNYLWITERYHQPQNRKHQPRRKVWLWSRNV